jgi:hypothetical protein
MRIGHIDIETTNKIPSTIGIKIANGVFYPILEENSNIAKRLVLTTAHDNQDKIKVNLYRSHSPGFPELISIGCLFVGNIKPKGKGVPSIELVIASTKDGEIIANAVEIGSTPNENQTLSVSLSVPGIVKGYGINIFAGEWRDPQTKNMFIFDSDLNFAYGDHINKWVGTGEYSFTETTITFNMKVNLNNMIKKFNWVWYYNRTVDYISFHPFINEKGERDFSDPIGGGNFYKTVSD